jgi:hypothetical protein
VALPTPSAPWRSTDRETLRQYLAWPATGYNLTQLTGAMNRLAGDSPETVVAIQGWMDEIDTLTQDWADEVSDGTAHLGDVAEYEGVAPGVKLTRQDRLIKADVLEWSPDLLKTRIVASGAASSTKSGQRSARLAGLYGRIFSAIGLRPAGGYGAGSLVRS